MPVYDPRSSMLNQLVGSLRPEDASVFDSTPKRIIRPIASLLGLDTEEGQAVSAATPFTPVAPLVSIYKSAAERAVGTEAFKETAKQFGGNIEAAANWLAAKYPRVAAHMKLARGPQHPLVEASAYIRTGYGKPTKPMETIITESGEKDLSKSVYNAKRTLSHEATHAAQALGNEYHADLYNAARKEFGFSAANPLETTAVNRGRGSELNLTRNGRPMTNRGTVQVMSPGIESTQKAIDNLRFPYDTADQRGLLNSVMAAEMDDAGRVPETANRLLRRMQPGPEDGSVNLKNHNRRFIQNILDSRGVPK